MLAPGLGSTEPEASNVTAAAGGAGLGLAVKLATGLVVQTAGAMSAPHALMTPMSLADSSLTLSCQVPATGCPSNVLRGCSGRYVPVNGALADAMGCDAVSLSTVFVKLLPEPPRRSTSTTVVPSGAISSIFRSLS